MMRLAPPYSVRAANRLDRWRQAPRLWPWARRTLDVAHFLVLVYAQFERDRCYQMASALTFSALLAVVPVTAVTFALFNSFGTFASIRTEMQQFLLRQLIPTSDLGQNLNFYLTQFTANTYQVTFLSVISLFVTAVTLFVTIEYSLGHVWTERRPRSFMRNVTIFTSILVWGPLLLGLSTYLSVSLSARAHYFVDPILTSRLWGYVFPFATSVLMFFLGFTILPSANVNVRAALVGASLSALLWEYAKYGFGLYTSRAVFYANVYGTLSTVPVFLLWLYVSWLIFLYGAEVCYCYQYRKWMRVRGNGVRPHYTTALLLGLASLLVIARRHLTGLEPPKLGDIAEALGIPEDVVGHSLEPLTESGLLLAVRGEAECYVPSRAPAKISALDVFRSIHPSPAAASPRDFTAAEYAAAGGVLEVLRASETRALESITVADLAARAEEQVAAKA